MWVLLKALFLISVPYSRSQVIHDGGTCGQKAIPYRISIDSKGSPKLYCLTPACLNDELSSHGDSRYRGDGERRSLVKCKPFKDVVCTGELQWTGGLLEVNNGTHNVLSTACCAYVGMARSHLVRTIFLGSDDSYEGGFHEGAGRNGGFDLIKEVRKSVNGDNRIQYIVTVHRLPCVPDRLRSKGYSGESITRNKRRQDVPRKENEYDYELEENDRPRRSYRDLVERPYRRNRRQGFRRRAMMRDYDDYYDYDYAVIVPRQMMTRRRQAANRLWPIARARADGGVFQPNDLIPIKPEQDVIVSSGSLDDFTQIAPPQQVQAARVTNSIIDGPLPPPSVSYQPDQQSLPQYVPAYREETAYNPTIYAQPPSKPTVQFRQPVPPEYPKALQAPIQHAQPAPQYYYTYPSYPAYYTPPGLNTIFEQLQCFSGDMEVETPSGSKAIKDVEVGDMVLSIDESMVTFSPVIMFLHKLESETAQFLQLKLESGDSLKITDNHLMYVANCNGNETETLRLVPAREARIGQCVQIMGSAASLAGRKITSIGKVTGVGIYAPLTTTGDIMVNRVLVSCHSNLALKTLQQTFFSVYRSLSTLLRYYIPKTLHDNAHLPFGVHYLTTIIDLFLPSSFL
ncbi:hypothetical protein RB195_026258 [Necator americanus]|uniref:Hint domain-containing protein n=1 Tax=Necator americanus TaxID=51031 RepID=A0ABR1EW59_NECAM